MSIPALASLLPLPVAFPLSGAVAAPLLVRLSGRLPVVVSLLALAGSAAVLLLEAPTVFRGRVIAHYMGHWTPVHGQVLGIAFAADPFGLLFALTAAIIGAVLVLYGLSELGGLGRRELGGFACLFQLLLAALIGAALTADLFNLFVWFEVAALASYGLTGFLLERPIALEAAFKILVLTTLASFAVFIGAGLLYAKTGALNYAQMHASLGRHLSTAETIALGLLVAGFGTKAGLVPFHGWLPDVHTAAAGPVNALFAGLMDGLGVIAIARVVFQICGTGSTPVLGLLMAIGLISALLGAIMALAQDNLKRLLAYDTISQVGIMVVGLATGNPAGIAGGIYHLINHALFKSLLFLCAGAIVHRTGATKLSEMGGLAHRMPIITAAFVLGCVSIAGIPPFNGYVSLSLIHEGLQQGHETAPYILTLIAQLITVAALGRAAWLAFFRRREGDIEWRERLRPGMLAGFAALGACCVAFGVAGPVVLRRLMAPAAASLLHPGDYARAVLAGFGRLPALHVPFSYGSPVELITVAVSTVIAAALAWLYLRVREPLPIRWLRALHTGSANDYAAYSIAGMLAVIAVLSLA